MEKFSMMDEEILTIREVADLLKLHPKTVNKFAISGKLPGLQDWSAVAVSEIGSPKSFGEARYLSAAANFEEVAKQIGLTLSANVMARVDRVIR